MEYQDVYYKCYSCGAMDRDKNPKDQVPIPIINCWNCHKGQGEDPGTQMERRHGMRLLDDREVAAYLAGLSSARTSRVEPKILAEASIPAN